MPVPDLATEDIPDDVLSSCSDLVEEVADPLLPADRTLVGLEEVTAKRVTARCYGPDMELRTVEFMPRTRPRRR